MECSIISNKNRAMVLHGDYDDDDYGRVSRSAVERPPAMQCKSNERILSITLKTLQRQ